ncbi:hypothetical protein SAY86_020047 [Trapa natans]|uniref:Uncharacterized protein n=1 Tax=Trapa natans TaxID=22666 RepID=A0AAN7LIE2_TRANT|nr:hypothetical protein SAY86_020047 [Trapa natans]
MLFKRAMNVQNKLPKLYNSREEEDDGPDSCRSQQTNARNCPAIAQLLLPSSLSTAKRISGGVRLFRQTSIISGAPESNMDQHKSQNPSEKSGNVMSQSFGEGYSTRSDEEGFGGIYSGDQSLNNIKADKEIHANHNAYDKTQGSEAKEKEQARHDTRRRLRPDRQNPRFIHLI